jgi:superfamily I DNA/RNA helicase
MDAVELARQVAADLHRQAFARGEDPCRPYEFALAEARRRDLDVESATPGAAVLGGGRATYVRADQLILHENVGTPFEQAFLIAHEIGHAELDDDPDAEPARDIDPVRSSEPSPIGIDRVVDYGRRQRREVQMDLFAREFLLPRPVVRALHLEEGLTASKIAARLGAPFEVVAQQLLDALLLPPIPLEVEAEGQERLLNPLQTGAAMHRGAAYLLEAGPGTGKTQTLTARVEGLLASGVDPRRILHLTFTNKAAGERAARIARKRPDAGAAMWVGTFHAFGLDVIRRFHAELGLPKDPRMMDRTEAVELLEQEFPRLGLAHYRNLYDPTQIIVDMLAAISRAKDEVVDAERYAELARMMRQAAVDAEQQEAAERALEVAHVYQAYETLKHEAHCVDFGDLVSMPVRLLEGNAAIRAHLRTQYDHVLVDEYQDVNRSSVRLLAALRGDGENLWAVGDAKQSIYRFRGASSFNMTRFGKEDFVVGVRGRLKRNYRSVAEVVAAFSFFGIRMEAGDDDSGLEPNRGPSGQVPELRTVDRAEQQTVALADTIEEMRRAGHAYRDQAVLCTGNEKLSTLGQDLERLGVPVLFLGSLFERPEVKELLSLLSILADRRAMGLVRVACLPEFSMPIADVAAVFDHLRGDGHAPGEWLQGLQAIPGLSEHAHTALEELAATLRGFDHEASPWDVLAAVLLDRTRIAGRIASSTEIVDRTRGIALWQLMNFIRVQPSGQGLPIARLLDRVRRLLRLGDDRDLRQLPAASQGIDAVRLMTIHGAKGLEFPVVHVPGLNAGTMPRTQPAPPCPLPDGMVEGGEGSALEIFRAGQAEEQECLFYVALSRARERLFLYAPTQNAKGHRRPLSPFLDRLGSNLVRQHVRPIRSLPPRPEAADITLLIDGRLRFSGPQIALYESCPRRFFYTHVLQVGGRRTATAFMQMHEAVRSVFQAVIAGDVAITSSDDLEQRVEGALAAHGLAGHGYLREYKAFALDMVRYFLSTRDGHRPEAPIALSLTFGGEQIIVRPDDVLVRADGGRVLRRIQTGHLRSTESKDTGAAAFMLAAQKAFPDAAVELVHLSDQSTQPIPLTPRELQNRQDKLAGFLADIRLGRFPADPSPRVCPGCPAFFVCGPTPSGELSKKF